MELASIAKNKRVIVDWSKTDRYRRIIGEAWITPDDCRICKLVLDVGLVWHYRAYERDQSIDARRGYR